MAHDVYIKRSVSRCNRCGGHNALLSTYHFGTTLKAECNGCGLGQVVRDTEDMVLARLNGSNIDYERKNRTGL